MSILRWFVGFIITVCVAGFAAMNRDDISVIWHPLDSSSIMLPLYLVVLGSMAFGFIFGGAVVWMNGGKVRREKRKAKKEIKLLEKEVNRLKDDKFTPAAPAVDVFHALPAAAAE